MAFVKEITLITVIVMIVGCGGSTDADDAEQLTAVDERAKPLAITVSAADPNTVLDWAEFKYPTIFPKGSKSEQVTYLGIRYTVRQYSTVAGINTLGIDTTGTVWGLGVFTAGQLTSFGPTADYQPTIEADACSVYKGACAASSPVVATSGDWNVIRQSSALDGTVSCTLSRAVAVQSGFTAYFGLRAYSWKPGSRSGFAPFPQDDFDPPNLGITGYCGAAACYSTNSGQSAVKVDNLPTRGMSKLNDVAFAANHSAFRSGGVRILTTDQVADGYEGLLPELLGGKFAIVRAVPVNKFFPNIEATIDLTGFGELLPIFNNCAKSRPLGPP